MYVVNTSYYEQFLSLEGYNDVNKVNGRKNMNKELTASNTSGFVLEYILCSGIRSPIETYMKCLCYCDILLHRCQFDQHKLAIKKLTSTHI